MAVKKIFGAILFFVLPILLPTTFAQDTKDIKGKVYDEKSGEALVYANVVIKYTSIGAATNADGYFILIDAPKDSLVLIVSYMGYKTKEIAVVNSEEQNERLEISLSPVSFITDEVQVLADNYKIWKAAENVSQLTISPKQLSTLPNLGEVDIFRSLQLLPGISGINDGSSGLYIRGGTPDQNLILLDGMTVYHVDHFFGFFSAFNSEAIKDVQVFKGGFPAKYGGRLSSVVDLTGKTGNVNDFKLSVGANLLSANAMMEVPINNKGSILISGRRSFADFLDSGMYGTIYEFLTGEEQESGPVQRGPFAQSQEVLPSFYFYDFNTKLSYQLSKNDFVSFSFYNGEDYLDESIDPTELTGGRFGGGDTELSITRTDDDITNWGNLGYSAKWSRQWGDRFYSNLLVSSTSYFNERDKEVGVSNTGITDSTGGFQPFSFKSFEDNNVDDITLRMDNEWNLDQNNKIGFGFWVSNVNTKFDVLVNDTLEVLNRDVEANQYSLYLQDEIKLTNRWNILPGMRTTYYDGTSEFYFEPRFSTSYKVTDRIKLKGAWGQTNQFINHITNEDVIEGTRDFWLVADEELNPGFSEHYIAGIEYETDDYLFSIEGYYKNLDNLIEFTQRQTNNVRRIQQAQNNEQGEFFVGSGFSKGIEFLAQKKFGAFNGWLSYTLGQVEYDFPELNNGIAFPADHDRRHEVKLIGTYTLGKWNFSSAWVFASGKAYTAPESQYYIELLDGETVSYFHVSDKNSQRLPDYHRLDISASYKFKNRSMDGEFGVSIYNLYNNENIWYKEYDLSVSPILINDVKMLGITPTVFVKFNF